MKKTSLTLSILLILFAGGVWGKLSSWVWYSWRWRVKTVGMEWY